MVTKKKTSRVNTITNWMLVISIISIVISSYLLYLHYANTESFCDFSKGLSCDIVNKSVYSEFPPGSGIPVSLMGIITFLIVIVSIQRIKHNKTIRIGKTNIDKKILSTFIFYLMLVSLLFALYLVYTELFLILSICILCVVLDIFIIIMLILSYKLRGAIYGKTH